MTLTITLRNSVLGGVALLALTAALPTIGQADVLETFDVQNCSANCGPGPFGTVLIQQNGTNSLNYTVQLNDPYDFHGTGLLSFVFDIVGAPTLTFSNFQIANQDEGVPFGAAPAGTLVGLTTAQHEDGFQDFDYGVNCPNCGPNNGGIDVQGIKFTVTSTSALFAQLGTANGDVGSHNVTEFGQVFSAASSF